MKFIVDAQLPKRISTFLNEKGHDSIHTLNLPLRNNTTDTIIIEISKAESRIVITKDADFLKSHLLTREPSKLIFIKTGNINNNELIQLFSKFLENITKSIGESNLIEIYENVILVR